MYDRMRSLCAPFLLVMFITFTWGTGVIAEDDAVWHVRQASGAVWVTTWGVQQASLTHARILKPGDYIRTGQNGRALLVRGEEFILISPNSLIEIPREKKEGLSTTIIQKAGSILLEVEKRNVKHFEVETPLLAALVKGTQFRITVEKSGTYVDVLRGQVEVSDLKSGQYALVQPGQTAKVSVQGSVGLSLSGSGTLSPIQQGTPRRSSVNPVPVPKEGRSATDSTPKGQQIHAVSLLGKVETIPASSGESAAKETTRISLLANPVPVPKEGRSAPDSAPKDQQVRAVGESVPALLGGSAAKENVRISSLAAPRQSVGNADDSSEPNDGSILILPLIVGIAVAFVIGTQRRRQRQK